MGRPATVDRARLGAELVARRDAGTCWKTLQRDYGLCRTRLWQLWKEAEAAGKSRAAAAGKNVHEHIEGFTDPAPAREGSPHGIRTRK